jgi:hypothetical protein
VPLRPLLLVVGIVAATGAWYVLTVDAITDTVEPFPPHHDITMAGVDPDHGTAYAALVLKNDSLLPITILRMEPIAEPSDWRVREMRLGSLTGDSPDPLARTTLFTPQHLAPEDVTHVVVVWAALPCDSPRLVDGWVSGPVEFRIVYSILGIHRTHTFRLGGGLYGPLSVIGCPTS